MRWVDERHWRKVMDFYDQLRQWKQQDLQPKEEDFIVWRTLQNSVGYIERNVFGHIYLSEFATWKCKQKFLSISEHLWEESGI